MAYLAEDALWGYAVIYVPYIIAVMWVANYFSRLDKIVIALGKWCEESTFT